MEENNSKELSLNEEDESQLCNLLPINRLFPANEILSQEYAPDCRVKVIISSQREQERKKNPFLKLFTHLDTLGFQYEKDLAENLVYSHLDNLKFMKHSSSESSTKYLAGLFLDDLTIEKAKLSNRSVYAEIEKTKITIKQSSVKFEASKSSSNLLFAFQKKPNQFDLVLHNDTNSKGSTQWFNFSVAFEKKETYKFNVVNLVTGALSQTKKQSLFNRGMKVAFYSSLTNRWERNENETAYAVSHVPIEERNGESFYKSLSFTYASNEKERVSFCYGYPYSIEDHEEYWKNSFRNLFKKIKIKYCLCSTVIGETVSGMKVQAFSIKDVSGSIPFKDTLRSIVFLARQHPGETQGSFITEGIVDYLMNSMNLLKKGYAFHFVPMVNAEGVLYGNYRTNLKGYDLNRNWRNPDKSLHPEPFYIKKYLKKINEEASILLIIDIHGHSKSLNSFFYGTAKNNKDNAKILPYFLSRRIKQISYHQCYFSVTEDKLNTARVVLSEMFPKALVYTLENSFHGWRHKDKIIDYSPTNLRKLGKELIVGILEFYSHTQTGLKGFEYRKELEREVEKTEKEIEGEPQNGGESDSEAEQQLLHSGSKEICLQSERVGESCLRRRHSNKYMNYISRKFSHERRQKKPEQYQQISKCAIKEMISDTMIRFWRTKSKNDRKENIIPLLSVNSMKPVSRQRRQSRKQKHIHGVNFVNDNEAIFEEVRRRKVVREEFPHLNDLVPCIIPLESKVKK